MRITDLLANNGYILVNKSLAKEVGLHEAIMIGELAQEYNYWLENNMLLEGGWFYSTIENVERATALTERQQKPVVNHLKELGIIEVKNMGIPCKRFFRIKQDKLLHFVESSSDILSEQEPTKCRTNNNKNSNKNGNSIYKTKPTLEEVKKYIEEKELNVDAEFFFEYFETGNWVDSKGQPVKNWKQKLLTWSRRNEHSREVVRGVRDSGNSIRSKSGVGLRPNEEGNRKAEKVSEYAERIREPFEVETGWDQL